MSGLCVESLRYGKPNAIPRHLIFYATYFFKIKFKAFNTLLNSAEHNMKRKRVHIFVVMPKNLAWTHQQVGSM